MQFDLRTPCTPCTAFATPTLPCNSILALRALSGPGRFPDVIVPGSPEAYEIERIFAEEDHRPFGCHYSLTQRKGRGRDHTQVSTF